MLRLLLLLPTTTYRTAAFLGAARKVGVEVVVASERAHVFQQAQPGRFLSLDFLHPDQAARQVVQFAATRPIDAVVGVDDATTVLAATLSAMLSLRHNSVAAAVASRSIGGLCSRTLRFGTGLSLEALILRHALGMEVPTLERERRVAGVMMRPVPRAGVLKEVRGQAEALAVPGIDEVAITAHPGQDLVPLPEGASYPGFIFARAESPERVEAALREAHRRLEFVVMAPRKPSEAV